MDQSQARSLLAGGIKINNFSRGTFGSLSFLEIKSLKRPAEGRLIFDAHEGILLKVLEVFSGGFG